MIEFSHVYKTYSGNIHALRNIDLQIDRGEFVFLTGPSGAGKTTLFKMLTAFDKPSSGEIVVAGQNLLQLSNDQLVQFRRRIGVVFQDFKLLKDRTLAENIALPLLVRGDSATQVERRVDEMLKLVGLEHRRDNRPEAVSGGEQQRTALARALVHQPSVLIADEPTGNLDPARSEEIMDLLERAAAQGTTVFVATHDQALVQRRRKRVLRIDQGLLQAEPSL